MLTPGRYVGAAPQADDGEPFEDKMQRLIADLRTQQAEGARLDAARLNRPLRSSGVAENLERLGFGGG